MTYFRELKPGFEVLHFGFFFFKSYLKDNQYQPTRNGKKKIEEKAMISSLLSSEVWELGCTALGCVISDHTFCTNNHCGHLPESLYLYLGKSSSLWICGSDSSLLHGVSQKE